MTWIWTKFVVILRKRIIFLELLIAIKRRRRYLLRPYAINQILKTVPWELKNLNRLESVLISRRLLFKKLTNIPKDCLPDLKGAIYNMPVETNDIVNVLPRAADSNGLIFVKLKDKLNSRCHMYLEALPAELVQLALVYLKQNNLFCYDIRIDIDNISDELLDLTEDIDQEIPGCVESNEEGENPLDSYLLNSKETMLISQVPTSEKISIAPGEVKKPSSILQDKYCEELAFPHIFSNGKFGYRVVGEVKLSPVKYFNQLLLNYTQLFASDSDYIFFALYVTQQLKLNSQISIVKKTLFGRILNAGMFSGKFTETVKSSISKDEAYNFMSSIKETPAFEGFGFGKTSCATNFF